MARPIRPWFRFYVEAFSDRKIRRLSAAQRWVWVAVLGAARESYEPGKLYVAPGVPMTLRELADYADVTPREVRSALASMEALGMVTYEKDLVRVTNWGRRQFESDNVTERTRDHRERSKEQDGNVPTNDEGTFQERSREQRRNTPERGRAFASETETETDNPLCPPGAMTGEDGATGKPAASPRQTRLAPDWHPTEAHRTAAAERGIDVDHEAEQFRLHAEANDRRQVRWNAAFSMWLNKARPTRRPDAPATDVRQLPRADELEEPPAGMSPDEYAEWDWAQRQKRRRAREA